MRCPDLHGYVWHIRHPELYRSARNSDPAGLQHTRDEVRILDQTPHSLFWDVDALGYICMGFATLFASFVFKNGGVNTWAKGFFIGNAVMTPVVALVYFYPTFSVLLLILGAPWLVTAAGSMFCLALYFKNAQLPQTGEQGLPGPLR